MRTIPSAVRRKAEDAAPAERLQFGTLQTFRQSITEVIVARLQEDEARAPHVRDWRGLNLDFHGAVFDSASFEGAQFTGGKVIFDLASFPRRKVSFERARFSGGYVSFDHAEFSGGHVQFQRGGVCRRLRHL